MENKYYPNDTPFQKLDCEVAFKNLSKREKLYAHFLSKYATFWWKFLLNIAVIVRRIG